MVGEAVWLVGWTERKQVMMAGEVFGKIYQLERARIQLMLSQGQLPYQLLVFWGGGGGLGVNESLVCY